MSLYLANVIWPYQGAFYAQLIPLFLLIEGWILAHYHPKARLAAFGYVLFANLLSSLAGLLGLSLLPFSLGWEPLVTKASDQYHSCILAFLVTVPIEYLVVGFSKRFSDRAVRFRAVFLMNFATYALCIAVITYHWTYGQNADWDELQGSSHSIESLTPDSNPDSAL